MYEIGNGFDNVLNPNRFLQKLNVSRYTPTSYNDSTKKRINQ